MSTLPIAKLWEIIQNEKGKPFLITGDAGSGKTFLLSELCSFLQEKRISYKATASTWLAALKNSKDSVSIHSFMGMTSIKQSELYYFM